MEQPSVLPIFLYTKGSDGADSPEESIDLMKFDSSSVQATPQKAEKSVDLIKFDTSSELSSPLQPPTERAPPVPRDAGIDLSVHEDAIVPVNTVTMLIF